MKVLLVLMSLTLFTYSSLKPDLKTYDSKVKPLLNKYCIECHGSKKAKGNIRFDNIDPNIISGKHQEEWSDTKEVFNTGEMPPEDEMQPSLEEREIIALWMDSEFKKAKLVGNPNSKGNVRRLTKYELQYALEDLLYKPASKAVEDLADESPSASTGLKNSSRLLQVSDIHMDSYFEVIFSHLDAIKHKISLKPTKVKLNISDLNKKQSKEEKQKKPFIKVHQQGSGLILASQGQINLYFPQVSKSKINISFNASAKSESMLDIYIGYRYSRNLKKESVHKIKTVSLSDVKLNNYSLDFDPESPEFKLNLSLENPYFIRLENKSSNDVYMEGLQFTGNLNDEYLRRLSEIESAFDEKKLIKNFLIKAFRRAPSNEELFKYLKIYKSFKKSQIKYLALLSTYEQILCSPKFFYIGLQNKSQKNAADYRLAERLSFFLWCSIPDYSLLEDAALGRLRDANILRSHISRMLKDQRARRMVERFTSQWLHTSKLFNIAVDDMYYRKFENDTKELMLQETYESVNDVFRNNSSALNLIKADHIFVNEKLARHYEIEAVKGDHFRKVKLNANSNRGGLLTQGTFLVANSDGINSHAILRGVWLTEIILNDPPPAAPANVPPFDEGIPGFEKMTLNEKLFAHRNNDACRSCHNKIDPFGLPFENFDASGAWRSKVLVLIQNEKKSKIKNKAVFDRTFVKVEAKSMLPSKQRVNGIHDLKEYIITHRIDDFTKGLIEKLLSFALSRDVTFYDEAIVNKLNERFKQSGYSVPDLINNIVFTPEFQKGALK